MGREIDLQEIADKLDFDLEDVEMLIEAFSQSVDENLQTLKCAIDKGDMDAIFKSAHAIKGSASNLTLNEISSIAKKIEQNARKEYASNYQNEYKKLYSLIDETVFTKRKL